MRLNKRIRTLVIAGASAGMLAAFDTAEDRADAHYLRGEELVELGDDVRAQLEFRNALKLDKSHIRARFSFAESLRRSDNIRGAVGQLLAVVELDPNFVPARLELGEIFLLANRPDDAETHIAAAIELAPDNPRARAMQATVDFKKGEIEKALERADGVLAEVPDNVTARLVRVAYSMSRSDLRAALAEVDAGLALSPGDLSLNVVKLGIAEQLGDTAPIGEQLENLVRMFPETNQFRISLSQWYLSMNRAQEAKAQLEALVANNPKDPKWGLDLVRLTATVDGREAAREALQGLINSDHPHAEYQFAMAALDLTDGADEDALSRLRTVAEEQGDSADGFAARIEIAKYMIRNGREGEGFDEIDYVLEKDPRNVEALGIRGARYIEADRPDLAIDDLRTALDSAPDNAKILTLLATAHERAGNRDLAIERMAQAASASGYQPEPTLRYVRELMSQEKNEVAERLVRDALKRRPDQREFLVAYAQLRLAKEDWTEVSRLAEKLRTMDPDDPAADRLTAASLVGRKMFGESIDVLAGAVEASGGDDAGAMMSLVRTYIAAGRVEEAETYLVNFVQSHPGNPVGLVMLGSLQAARGKLDEAEAAFISAIESKPDLGVAYASLASIYQRKGDSDAALEQIRAGIAASDSDNLRIALAMRLEATGDFDAAIEAYGEIYARNPANAVVANNLSSLLADHRADQPDEVERAFNIAQRFKQTDNPYMLDTYAWLLHLRGDTAEAIGPLSRASELLPNNALVQYHLGIAYETLGSVHKALSQMQRAVELSDQTGFAFAEEASAAQARLQEAAAAAPAPKETE